MAIFKKSDFILCDVPCPKGYPQSQTHCSIKQYNDTIYLLSSPYPVVKRSRLTIYVLAAIKKLTCGKINLLYKGEDFENPCLYVANDKYSSRYPTSFVLIEGSPLMTKPEDLYGYGAYCSDPDLLIKNDSFYILNRVIVRNKNEVGDLSLETSNYLISGQLSQGRFVNKRIVLLNNKPGISPCIIHFKGKYLYFSLDTSSYNTGDECKALNVRQSESVEEGWSEAKIINMKKGRYEPWHMSVFSHNNHLYAIIACVELGHKERCWQMFGEFDDEIEKLYIYQTPLTSYNSYRGAAIVTEDGEFLLYNTTVNERLKGSYSVDGRDVVMAHMPFENLLNTIKKQEKDG